jgi:hypothetical protein
VLLVISEKHLEKQAVRKTNAELRDHLGHVLLYLRSWNFVILGEIFASPSWLNLGRENSRFKNQIDLVDAIRHCQKQQNYES